MATELHSHLTGRDHFDALYNADLDAEAEWLQRGAAAKADSIEFLIKKHRLTPQTILELGAGTGAVISELERRQVAKQFVAVEYSESATELLRASNPKINVIRADIMEDLSSEKIPPCDMLVLSHVVEHLENPTTFLKSMRDQIEFKYAIIEVPLEDLVVGRLKLLVKDRSKNLAGHVQFFTPSSFERLVTSEGFEIVDRRRYCPVLSVDTLRFLMVKDRLPWWRFYSMCLTRRILPQAIRPVWERISYAHYAVLCKKA